MDKPSSSLPVLAERISLWIGCLLGVIGLVNILPGYGNLPRLGPFALEWYRPFFFTLCVLVSIAYGWKQLLGQKKPITWSRIGVDAAMILVTLFAAYESYRIGEIMVTSFIFFNLTNALTALAMVAVATVLCWRLWGAPIALIGLLALFYLMTGQYWPGVFETAGGNLVDTLASNLWFSSANGLMGSIFGVILSTVLPFIVLGAVLEGCGAGGSMIRISFNLMRRFAGGPAYAAIMASGMFGTVSGSAVANVVGTGVVTIPMIRRRGFSENFAGGVESSASAGGQILPPIMGAAALIMADYVGVSYLTVILAVLIPAITYYASLFLAVYFEARRLGIAGGEGDGASEVEPIARQDWVNLLLIIAPLAIIVWLLVYGLSPSGASISAILALIPLSFLNPEVRAKPSVLLRSIAEGGITIGRLSMAIAVVGVIVATLSATGIPTTFAVMLSNASDYSLLAALVITAVGCIILGMGMPTLPAYIAIIAVMGPTLQAFGMTTLTAHMFVFFFGVASVITPPVAIAAYAAASVSGGSPMATAITSTRLSAVMFLIPFAFAYNPLMLTVAEAGAEFTLGGYLWMLFQLAGALYMVTSGLARYDRAQLSWPETLTRIIIAVVLLSPYALAGALAFAAGLALLVRHYLLVSRKNSRPASRPEGVL